MIQSNQSTIFSDLPVKCIVSSLQDGGMHFDYDDHNKVLSNFKSILNDTSNTALIRCTYDKPKYTTMQRIKSIDELSAGSRLEYDALTTDTPCITLAVPVADCLVAVLYDPINKASAIAHMGRHATVDNLLPELVKHMTKEYGTNPNDLIAYFSPSIKKTHYFMEYWDESVMSGFFEKKNDVYYLDLPGFNKQQLIDSGVQENNIEISPVNTATNENYGSHFMHKIDPDKPDDRFLVAITLEK